MKAWIGLAAVALLGACGGGEGEGGLSREENEQLNEAANMVETLDASPDSMTVTDETGLGNAEAADANAQ